MKNCWYLAFVFGFSAFGLSACASQPADVVASSENAAGSSKRDSTPVEAVLEDSVARDSVPRDPAPPIATPEPPVPLNPESIVETALFHELGKALTINVSSSHAHGSWLLLSGSPQDPATGTPLDYTGTPYESRMENGAFDDIFMALLQRKEQSGAYQLRELSFGTTDTPLPEWQSRYQLPPKLLEPFAEGEQFLQW